MEYNYAKITKALRGKLGLSQSRLAGLLGVSFATINRWENGKFNPTLVVRNKISNLCIKYGINLDDFKD